MRTTDPGWIGAPGGTAPGAMLQLDRKIEPFIVAKPCGKLRPSATVTGLVLPAGT